jgi:hypothetical protein
MVLRYNKEIPKKHKTKLKLTKHKVPVTETKAVHTDKLQTEKEGAVYAAH